MDLEEIISQEVPEIEMDTVVWMSDQHVPYHDKKTHRACLKLLNYLQPDVLVIGGDFVDFYSVSQYDKDPRRAHKLQPELNKAKEMLGEIREVAPDTRIVYLEGNHETRLVRYLKKHPELWGLDALKMEELLDLGSTDIEYKEHFMYHQFLFKHGDYVNKYAANKEMEVEGVSGMNGHTHRNQVMTKNTRGGDTAWYNIGHLSDEKFADYITGIPNWQQGLAVIYFKKGRGKRRFQVHMVPITKSKFIFDGREFDGT